MIQKIHKLKTCVLTAWIVLLGQGSGIFAQQSANQSASGVVALESNPGGDNLSFQADLFTGRFTYGIPIKVAPGRQGAEPKLTLGYNSASANGWCGMGWSLEVGYIQRDTRHGVPIQWSVGSTNALPQYDDSKGFVANIGGSLSKLVCVSGTNQNPIVYRQQVDTAFLTYNYYTNNHWEVVDKGGNTFYFGEGITNQMENNKTNWTQGVGSSTFRWAFDRVVDANGNETFLNYASYSGQLYLTNLQYNASVSSPALAATHEVDFILTNRPDTSISYISGYRVTSTELLSEIDVKVSGANVRKYVLGYIQSPSTYRSLLASVTEYGGDYSSSLPPITFQYQNESCGFRPSMIWPGVFSQGQTNNSTWNSLGASDSYGAYVTMLDIDGDGFPDRVMRKYTPPYTNYFAVQRNTGTGFAPLATNYQWGVLNDQGQTDPGWNSPQMPTSDGAELQADIIDINGDGLPDRVEEAISSPYTNWFVQLNTGVAGSNGFAPQTIWTSITTDDGIDQDFRAIRSPWATGLTFIDINSDGLPDRVMADSKSSYTRFKVQLNTGTGFTTNMEDWAGVDTQGTGSGYYGMPACSVGYNSGGICSYYTCTMADINGDGLPDRVMLKASGPYTNLVVQFNNGAGFEPPESWGPIDTHFGDSNYDWCSPVRNACVQNAFDDSIAVTLQDINGDGLPDRLVQYNSANGPISIVQLNTGSGFGPAITNGWQFGGTDISFPGSKDLVDMNGDGLPDMVYATNSSAPYTNWIVQLNNGPFPDLLNIVSNGIGCCVQISYIASTTLNNRDKDWTNDPWAEGTKSLLPFNVWVVTNIVVNDGMGNNSTNFYAFKGGYYNAPEREFRGFSQCTVTDPMGTKTMTYFHQSGGRDNSALGEYQDQGSESKKGIPFRIDVIGSDGTTNKITLNKVQELLINSNGWYFPFTSQTIAMNYEGLSSYRATAKQFSYDTNTENLVEEVDLGEVTNVIVNGQAFTDVGNDSVYMWMTYTNLGRPADIKVTSDSAGNNRLRETQMTYDSHGNLTGNQVWLDTASGFIAATTTAYDQYGNPIQATDAAGITTKTSYDPTYQQYPIAQVTATFTNKFSYDVRSGSTVQAIDAKGLVASNSFDAFYRSTGAYISTNAFGPPSLWKTKTTYSLGGITSGVSANYIYKQANSAVDPINGFQTYTYLDGIGRTVQTRTQSEITGQFRAANVCYDLRGNVYFQTLPYFSSGTGFTSISGSYLGTLAQFDSIGRADQVTPAVQGNFNSGILTSTNVTGGDSGSPVGPVTTAFVDGGNPWSTVVTDSGGKVKKSYRDAYARTIRLDEVTSAGNYNTTYTYDLVGNLTNVTDNANNTTTMVFDSLGRKTLMTDSDMGTWTYVYDNAGRMTQQIDARGNKLTFDYSDVVGRLLAKRIYNPGGTLVGAITYTYDTSDDPNYTVFKGQLYKVTDLQGYQRSSYDVRGRVIQTGRFLNINSMEYVTQTTYDDADRVQTLTYPGNAATIKYTFDVAGNLIQVKSLAGTGIQEIFCTPQSFNALGQLTGYTDGAGVVTTNIYFANSSRLQRVWVSKGATNLQDLSYTYDTLSDLKSISDNVYTGSASASISSISYDDLYRVTSVSSTARGVTEYAYDSIGNVLTNQDFGNGLYQYGGRPHAVTSANGISYSYDPCGNMTNRGAQTLVYDEQNQLTKVINTNDSVLFGYGHSGERLWRCGTNGYSIWIGGIYEVNNGKVLCHVFAGGKRIATFEPLCGGLWSKAIGEKNWYLASTRIESIFNWPFENGRGQWTVLGGTWAATIGVCMLAGRRIRLQRSEIRKVSWPSLLWRQAVTFVFISAFLLASTPEVHAAPAYNPVFYYYHNDNVGSSNILTDRSGSLVQQYQYATFGLTSYQNNTSAYPVSNRYTGQIADDETGLYYYGARYYDPQLGRFIQPDTLVPSATMPQTLNRYSYCENNPLNFIDPSGHGFFSSLFGSIASFFSSPFTWFSAFIGFAVGGPIGALIGLGIGVGIAAVTATVGYFAGARAGMITGAVLSIAVAAYGIYEGVGLLGTHNATAVMTIVSASLSIGSSSASLAGDQGLARSLGYASLGASALAAGSKIPLIYGMATGAANTIAGMVNCTLAIATFGISGTMDLGLNEIVSGLKSEWDILLADIHGTIAGIEGKIYTAMKDTLNLLTLGQVTALGTMNEGNAPTEPTGILLAAGRLVKDGLFPFYGNFGGPNWGIPTVGMNKSLIINNDDYANFMHDFNGDDWGWVMNQFSINTGYTPDGPVGAAYALVGVGPFTTLGALQYLHVIK